MSHRSKRKALDDISGHLPRKGPPSPSAPPASDAPPGDDIDDIDLPSWSDIHQFVSSQNSAPSSPIPEPSRPLDYWEILANQTISSNSSISVLQALLMSNAYAYRKGQSRPADDRIALEKLLSCLIPEIGQDRHKEFRQVRTFKFSPHRSSFRLAAGLRGFFRAGTSLFHKILPGFLSNTNISLLHSNAGFAWRKALEILSHLSKVQQALSTRPRAVRPPRLR